MRHIPIRFNDFDDGEPSATHLEACETLDLTAMRLAQQRWAGVEVKDRMSTIGRVRHAIAHRSAQLVRSQTPRDEAHAAEIMSSQVIPLADACRFLERKGASILRARRMGRQGRPLWLAGTSAEIRREPHGIVLIIAPSNYPLFLMGVPLVQALAAGNAVLLKPAPGCATTARLLGDLCVSCGVPTELVKVLPEDTASFRSAVAAGVDKVLFTGSARTGSRVLAELAPHLVPATMELSGSDAMFVLDDADLPLAARSLLFGLTLNRGATCIAPRRVFVDRSRAAAFEQEILREAARHQSWEMEDSPAPLAQLVVRAAARGARLIVGELDHHGTITAPLVLADAAPDMAIMREDHFGPATCVVPVADGREALRLNRECAYALGASVFSRNLTRAREFAGRIKAGSVVINDLIVPTADPRLPFGGRGLSGFGVMRGTEGLLELTVPKVVMARHGSMRPHLQRTPAPEGLLENFLNFIHAATWRSRMAAAWRLIVAAQRSKS